MKVFSKRYKGLLLWDGKNSEKLDVQLTDFRIFQFLRVRREEWSAENPETEDSHNYEDWLSIAEHEHWGEMLSELARDRSSLLVWRDKEDMEMRTLLSDAGLSERVNFEVVKVGDVLDVKVFNNDHYACLSRDLVHEALEECVLSSNKEGYFWYLLDKKSDKFKISDH